SSSSGRWPGSGCPRVSPGGASTCSGRRWIAGSIRRQETGDRGQGTGDRGQPPLKAHPLRRVGLGAKGGSTRFSPPNPCAGPATAHRPLPTDMSYALQTLWHERQRYAAGVFAVTFSAVLIALQCGLLLGLFKITSIPIDHTRADVWVGSKAVPSVDLGKPIP